MKSSIAEFDNTFYITFEAETVEDAAILARMGINYIKQMEIGCDALKDGTFIASISIGKRKFSSSIIK